MEGVFEYKTNVDVGDISNVRATCRREGASESNALFSTTAIKLRLSSGKLLSTEWSASVDSTSAGVRYDHVEGYTVVLQPGGEVRCEANESATSTISELRMICELGDEYTHCLVQGFQSWNLNKSCRADESRRNSIASKLPTTAMFKDTDHPVWRDSSIYNTPGFDSFDVLVFTNDKSTMLFGAASCFAAQTAFWVHSQRRTKKFVSFEMSISFGCHSKSHGNILNEKLTLLSSNSPDDTTNLLKKYATTCQAVQYNSIPMESPLRKSGRAPVGYGSWYQFYDNVTSDDMTRIIGSIESDPRLFKLVDVIQLDDGFQLNTGDWLHTRKRFGENELSAVAARIKAIGKTPGLWTAPFLVSKTSNVAKEHPDWLLRNRSGKANLFGYVNPVWMRGGSPRSAVQYVLDASHPEVLRHLEETFAALSEDWDFFKIDFLAAGMREGMRYDSALTRVEAYIQGLKAIRKGVGTKGFIVGCGAPMLASAQSGTLDAMRVTCDTVESWKGPLLLRKFAFDWDNIPSCETSLRGNMMRMYMHGKLWAFNDPDCLVLRKKGSSMSLNQVVTQITILGLTGGLLLFTDDMTKLEPERLKLALRILPTSTLSAAALNLSSHPRPEEFVMTGEKAAVRAILNWRSSQKKSLVSYTHGAFEFWSEQIINEATWTHKAYQPCVLQYPLEPTLLLGTTLHLTAIADGRIQVVNETKGRDTLQCVVSGDNSLGVTKGKLIFIEPGLAIMSSSGVSTAWNTNDPRVLEIEIVEETWQIVVVRS